MTENEAQSKEEESTETQTAQVEASAIAPELESLLGDVPAQRDERSVELNLSSSTKNAPDDMDLDFESDRHVRSPSRGDRDLEAREHTGDRDDRDFGYDDTESILPTPPARKGMVQRWVSEDMLNKGDARNWTRKMRMGYKPRQLDTIDDEFHPPAGLNRGDEQLGNILRSGEMVLCEIPEEIYNKRRKKVATKTNRQTEAIMEDLEGQNDPNAPMQMSGKRNVSVSTRAPRVARDDS